MLKLTRLVSRVGQLQKQMLIDRFQSRSCSSRSSFPSARQLEEDTDSSDDNFYGQRPQRGYNGPSQGSRIPFRNQTDHFSFDRRSFDRRDRYFQRSSRRDNGMSIFDRVIPKEDFTSLQPIEKDFYEEHPNVNNRPQEEIEQYMKQHDVHVKDKEGHIIPRPILKFDELNINEKIEKVINYHDMTNPTVIQAIGWPLALSGKDTVGIAQTGSGKTLAYMLPGIIHAQQQQKSQPKGPIMLVLVPTRELAQQVEGVARKFGRPVGMRSAAVFGGANRAPQQRELFKNPEILIATPGRLIDFLHEGAVSLKWCSYLVMDEADRMLDMGFEPQIRQVVRQIRPDRQTLMWSATWPQEMQSLARDFLKDYTQINIGSYELQANPNITQNVHVTRHSEKWSHFQTIIDDIAAEGEDNKTLVFVATKAAADMLKRRMRGCGLNIVVTHGDKTQKMRDEALKAFRSGRAQVLIATDVAARGLDVDDIKVVINYDCPNNIEDYIHRIGRTARASKTGIAHTFFTENDVSRAKDLIKVMEQVGQTPPQELYQLASVGGKTSRQPRRSDNRRRYDKYDTFRPGSGKQYNRPRRHSLPLDYDEEEEYDDYLPQNRRNNYRPRSRSLDRKYYDDNMDWEDPSDTDYDRPISQGTSEFRRR